MPENIDKEFIYETPSVPNDSIWDAPYRTAKGLTSFTPCSPAKYKEFWDQFETPIKVALDPLLKAITPIVQVQAEA